MTKYRNHRVGNFASKLEASVHQQLQLREKAGELRIIQTQEPVTICGKEGHGCSSKCRIQYLADFTCEFVANGERFHVEAKGMETDTWRLKRRLWFHYGPGVLEIWKGSWQRPVLAETIVPRGEE